MPAGIPAEAADAASGSLGGAIVIAEQLPPDLAGREIGDEPELITIPVAAARLGLSRSKLYELIADGELPTVRIGRARRVAVDDLRSFIAQHRVLR